MPLTTFSICAIHNESASSPSITATQPQRPRGRALYNEPTLASPWLHIVILTSFCRRKPELDASQRPSISPSPPPISPSPSPPPISASSCNDTSPLCAQSASDHDASDAASHAPPIEALPVKSIIETGNSESAGARLISVYELFYEICKMALEHGEYADLLPLTIVNRAASEVARDVL